MSIKITGKSLIKKLTENDVHMIGGMTSEIGDIYQYKIDGKYFNIFTRIDGNDTDYATGKEIRKSAYAIHDIVCNHVYDLDEEIETYDKKCNLKK